VKQEEVLERLLEEERMFDEYLKVLKEDLGSLNKD